MLHGTREESSCEASCSMSNEKKEEEVERCEGGCGWKRLREEEEKKRGRKGNFDLILGAAVDSCLSLNWYFECECARSFSYVSLRVTNTL